MMYTSTWTFDCVLDINECQGDHGCDQECVNDVGGFHCECRTGYQLVDTFSCAGQLIAHAVRCASILAAWSTSHVHSVHSHGHCHDNILYTY